MLSYLALKLLGKERLCDINDLSFDAGLGVFAGLNVLPKSTAISSYSYRHKPSLIRMLLKGFSKTLHKNGYIKGANVNLDFHSIPFFGDEPSVENHWVPTRGKGMKSVLSFFAQDLDTTFLIFSDGNIKADDANDEILEFVKFYKSSIGLYPECLIFDSKLTTYQNLYKLHKLGIRFITLGRRGKGFSDKITAIKQWKGIKLDGITREYKNLKYSHKQVKIRDYPEMLNEIIVKGNGRELPMRLITNDDTTKEKEIIQKYTKRWRIGVSSEGHIIQSVQVRPRVKGSTLVAWEAPLRETKAVKPSDIVFNTENMQHSRLQRAVNVEVASLHANPMVETVDNARRQQELVEKSQRRQFSSAGYQRWHGVKDYVETGEALDARRRNIAEEADPITLNGKWKAGIRVADRVVVL